MLACPQPIIHTSVVAIPAIVHNNASVKTITDVSGGSHPAAGLYRSNARFDIKTRMKMSTGTTIKELCITDLYITYSLGHSIEIAREYPPGTCAYNFAVGHEKRHESIQVEQAHAANTYLEYMLHQHPLYFKGVNAEDESSKWTQSALTYAKDVYNKYILPAQQDHDSLAEYQRFADTCPDSIMRHR